MLKESSRTVVPNLRFPEFQKATGWKLVPLEKIAVRITTKNTDGTATRVLTNSAEHGVLDQRDYFAREIASASKVAGYYVVDVGDYVYNPRTSAAAPVGPVSRNNVGKGVMSPLYTVFRFTATETDFYKHFFKSTAWHAYVRKAASTGARHDRMSITATAFMQMPVPTPKEDEQHKIADCLDSLDRLVAAQERKVSILKTYRRGLMEHLFPRAGENVPRFRFPEFCDSPEWEPKSLNAIVDFQSGGTPSKANPEFWNGSIPWVSAKDMKRLFLDESEDHISVSAVNDGAKVAPAGSVLILTRGMTLLKDVPICVLRRDMSFNQDVKALRPKGKTEGLFVAHLLLGNKQRLLKMVDIAGHGTGKLNTDKLKALELTTPKPAEQRRIVEFLTSLDAQLEAEANKLAMLNTHKDGLLQKIIPRVESIK